MSWLNNSLNSIKGQLTTLAHEVLAETAGPGDDDYRGPEIDNKTALELLADTQKEKEQLDKLCIAKESEIAILRKQITELQNKISDSGGGNTITTTAIAAGSGNSGRTSKSPTDNNTTLEDSWCWEPDNAKPDNDHSSETSSSGNGHEMVNITLEEVQLGATASVSKRAQRHKLSDNSPELQRRIHQLEEDNKQLNLSLEELDMQHNLAMQNVLELKTTLQDKLTNVTRDYDALKKEHAEKFINGELELGKLKKQYEQMEREHKAADVEKQSLLKKNDDFAEELKKAIEEMADLQALLEKKSQDNVELIERVKAAGKVADKAEEERADLQLKVELLTKDMTVLKQAKEKKTSESSNSSTGKHSEDEFIVVREGDANSSGPSTPPTKEELRERLVELENRVSELTLENGSLALKIQEREMEKELSATVLKEHMQSLQLKYEEQTEQLKLAQQQLDEQQEKVDDLKEKAADAFIAQEQLKALTQEKQKIESEIEKMKESLSGKLELEKRLIFSEQEKENLQLELQGLRTAQERVAELESKMQKLTLENQQYKLNAEAETETLNNSAELEDKLSSLKSENLALRTQLENIAQLKFRQAIAEEKQEITDLDAEEEEEPFSLHKLRELLDVYIKQDLGVEQKEATEIAYKTLRERLSKIHALERSQAQMAENILDLQDNKLVWDHEKKTLEADISQYILQCDELMKNNEILLNELENYKRNKLETISENNEENMLQLETQLEECTNLNRTLEEEYAELNEKIDELEQEKQALTEQLRVSQIENESWPTQERNYKLQLETLELEKCNLLFEINELRSTDEKDGIVNEALKQAEEKYQSSENQLARLSKDHADLVAAMQAQKAALMEANKKREDTEKTLKEQHIEACGIRVEVENLRTLRLQNENELKQELCAKDIVAESLKNELQTLKARLVDLDSVIHAKEALEQQLKANEQLIIDLQETLQKKVTQEEGLRHELVVCAELQATHAAEFEKEQQAKQALETQYQALLKINESAVENLQKLENNSKILNCTDTDSLARIAHLEAQLLETADLQKNVDSLNYEKNEMIKALQQKHAENMQYYTEIQRLQPIIAQFQQEQQQITAAVESKPCEKCPNLASTIETLQKEQEKLQDQINFLKEKSDILTTNLLTEQTNQRLVQQEKSDVEKQNADIRKDLERLRAHLLEIEDMHTHETMEMQRELDETKAKMTSLLDEVSQSSNAYTSASIRANQHAETLQAQYVLLVQQRDELVAKLSFAEDRESKNQAALCNLQCALEQFQNDKENEIKVGTQRIRKELQQELHKESQLQSEIAALNQQLADANQGLRAASRLSDQLEACQETIAALREEVETLKQQNSALEAKLNTSESSQSDKIDKNLIKSLLIGYVVSGSPNDKNQVLRMISSVLDFNASESDKVGLNKQQSSWLGAILGGGGSGVAGAQGSHSKENLVQAFVQFLEQESQPKASTENMPNLLNMTQGPAAAAGSAPSRRTSLASNSGGGGGAPIPIQPLLMNSNVLDEFAPSRNSSSILKDILSDS